MTPYPGPGPCSRGSEAPKLISKIRIKIWTDKECIKEETVKGGSTDAS